MIQFDITEFWLFIGAFHYWSFHWQKVQVDIIYLQYVFHMRFIVFNRSNRYNNSDNLLYQMCISEELQAGHVITLALMFLSFQQTFKKLQVRVIASKWDMGKYFFLDSVTGSCRDVRKVLFFFQLESGELMLSHHSSLILDKIKTRKCLPLFRTLF